MVEDCILFMPICMRIRSKYFLANRSKEVKKLLRSEMLEGQQVPISILKFGEEDTREDHPGEFQWIQSLFCLGNKSSRICFLNGTVRLRKTNGSVLPISN